MKAICAIVLIVFSCAAQADDMEGTITLQCVKDCPVNIPEGIRI